MNLLRSLVISFSMYSIIPMPKIEWEKESMKYTFVFFPWIGLLIGGITYGWFLFSMELGLSSILTAVILILIPMILSGGIHMDGLIDTCDAVFSYGDKEKKLEILKDPRTGAFGVIGCSVYLLLMLGVSSQLLQSPRYAILLCLIFVISRIIGAITLLTVKKAKPNGLGTTFADAANDRINLVVLLFYLILSFVLICSINLFLGAFILLVLCGYLYYYISAIKKNFGGITGDLTGFLITSVEFILLFIVAIGGVLC